MTVLFFNNGSIQICGFEFNHNSEQCQPLQIEDGMVFEQYTSHVLSWIFASDLSVLFEAPTNIKLDLLLNFLFENVR